MGKAIDTIASTALNPGATVTATTIVTGDSFTVRNFAPTAQAKLINLIRRGATSGIARVRSPLFHDNVRGVQVTTGETPSAYAVPAEIAQPVQAQDNLIVEVTGGAAETEVAVHQILYTDLLGAAARLAMPGDVVPLIKNIKPITVAITNSATIGAWTDTVITTTENLMHANADYAVLGYITDTALACVGVKGQETANLRVGGPGLTSTLVTSDYFYRQALFHNLPFIPVINANNRFSIFVSTNDSVASSTANITLICAELSSPAPV